jgi:hypothetical protein
MRDSPDTVSINDRLAEGSGAYLAMWSALEGFNPKADRWSEPFDFGDSDERLRNAENAIARLHETVKKPDPKLLEDIDTFWRHASTLRQGGPFSEAIGNFSLHLRERGSEMADESVQLIRAKPTDAEGNR